MRGGRKTLSGTLLFTMSRIAGKERRWPEGWKEMLKRLAALILSLVTLSFVLPAGAGKAGDLNDYAICSFSRSFPVYTGPGEEYFRVDGSAKYGSGSCRVWGVAGDWLMVGFLVKSGKYRIGYIAREALSCAVDPSGKLDRALSFLDQKATVVKTGAPLTDDPVLNNERFCFMLGGQEVVLLGYYGNWAYVETDITTSQRGRGSVRKFNLVLSSGAAPVLTPVPTALPTAMPALTPVPTVGAWSAGEDGMLLSTWVPQATVRPEEWTPAQRAPVPGGSLLLSLEHNCPATGVMLPAAFDPHVTSYVLTVASWVSRIRFTPSAADKNAIITVNGETVPSGTPSSYVTLGNEPKRVEIVVWDTGGAQTVYTVFLQRRPSEKKTGIAVAHIRSLEKSGAEWILTADPVDLIMPENDYMNGSRSTWTDASSDPVLFTVDPHCDMWYGRPDSALQAADVMAFAAAWPNDGTDLYYIVYIEDALVAVMPYEEVRVR